MPTEIETNDIADEDKPSKLEALVPAGGPVPNIYAVGAVSDGCIAIMRTPPGMITADEARNLAAYLVALSGGLDAFLPVLSDLESGGEA